MSWMKHTGCRYHTQDTGYYCGAASAMMILAEIGVPYSALDQDDLYTSNHDHNAKTTGWATDPYGLKYTLNDRRPSSAYYFVVHKPTSEVQGTRDIVYTLHKYNVSPAVLVYGCMHWIVIPGVQTDVEPVPGTTYTVEGFWIHNPVYYASSPPPPHNATDGCGSGGALGNSNDFVTYAGWQSTYFTGCNYDDPAGSPQYISVCDPDVRDIELPLRREKKFLADGRKLIDPKRSIEFANRGLDEYRLREDKRVAEIFEKSKPGKAQPVARLDRPNTYYYLAPWETAEGTTALVQVDARFGIFLSLHLREQPRREEFLSKEAILKRVAYKSFELEEQRGRLVLRPESACLAPTLVWQPCWESWSPHLPFYQFTIGEYTIYVRVDGEVFTKLTTTGRGV